MKMLLALFCALALVGCGTTQQQVTYQTLAASSEALRVSTAAWKDYVDQAKANGTVSKDTLVRQSLEVQAVTHKAGDALDVAISIAGTTQAPTTASVTEALSEVVTLINKYTGKK